MSFFDPLQSEEAVPLVAASALGLLKDRLPNASVGRHYMADIAALFGEHLKNITWIDLQIPEGFGLLYDRETGVLQGDPLLPGEFELALCYKSPVEGTEEGGEAACCLIRLTVNPDPVSLWKNIPSDPEGLFAKPDSEAGFFSGVELMTLAASLRGRSHAHEGGYRDDDYAVNISASSEDNASAADGSEMDAVSTGKVAGRSAWSIFVVADGAGSARLSRRGSQLACTVAAGHLREQLQADNELDEVVEAMAGLPTDSETLEKVRCLAANIFTKASYEAFSAIYREAGDQAATLRDFATTFIGVLLRPCAGGWFFAAFSIGDGGAGIVVEPGSVEILTQADSGEHAGTTLFLTKADLFQKSESLLARTRVLFCESFRFMAVMTDGVSDPLFPSDAAFESPETWAVFEEELLPVVDFLSPQSGMEAHLLEWLNFRSPGNHDDRTLLLVVPCRPSDRTTTETEEVAS